MTYVLRPAKGKVLLCRYRPFTVFLKLGGDIYKFHLELGPLTISWDAKEAL